MNGFTRVLFEVNSLYAHQPCGTVAHFNQHFAFADDGVIKLRNLIALGQVGIKVIFAVKRAFKVDLGLEAQSRAHGLFDTKFVYRRQHAGHGRVDERHVAVWFGTEFRRGG